MLVLKRLAVVAVMVLAIVTSEGAALAGLGQPSPWQIGLQQSASPVMENIVWFHDFLLYIITAITVFVLVLLVIVIVRFNARANPIPSRTTTSRPRHPRSTRRSAMRSRTRSSPTTTPPSRGSRTRRPRRPADRGRRRC